MAADSPKRSIRCIPAVVPAQAVNDRSIIDSVAGFINDVTLTNLPQGGPKESILWVQFETLADTSDPTFGEDWELEGGVAPPLLLILGYGCGVQVWAIPANGEAIEVLSWRHGVVRAIRILPTPFSSDAEMADEPIDQYAHKRPLMAICDSLATNPGSQLCSINFVSLKDGNQVKIIKFKNSVVDIHANRTSIVVTFSEKIAVFDAISLEDRLTVTTCHPSPGICPNPIALGTRWMAYAERKLLPSKRSSGGCDFDGVSSYTATVLNAAKSLGKGLRELGEQMAAGLTGSTSQLGSSTVRSGGSDTALSTTVLKQPGVVSILDIKYSIKEASLITGAVSVDETTPFVAHFIAHSDAIIALSFDSSGMLLLSADKRGHDFHVFRIHLHPGGSPLASVHHLYVLHRGDTRAKVQDIAFSLDSRWVAVSTLRGTTHVFPITPYGGPAGLRTHGSLHVVNRLSRFHRSAGLPVEARSNSPAFHSECPFSQSCMAYNNPRMPPFPRPTVVLPLAQLRQPSVLGSPPGSSQNAYSKLSHARQRVSSLSDEMAKPLRVCAMFAKARSWLFDTPNATREIPAHRIYRKVVDSLFIMAGHGALIQYDLDVKHTSNIPKEKVSNDTPIELEVEAKAQWNLIRKDTSSEIQPPLADDNCLLKDRLLDSILDNDQQDRDDRGDRWLSQVEIITHAGPHRRLWMGPQFTFKTYNTPSGSPLNHIDSEAIEIGITTAASKLTGSNPMNVQLTTTGSRSTIPVLIESESCTNFEQSPRLMDKFRHEHMDSDYAFAHGDSQLKEDLADAMRESPAVQLRETGISPSYMSSASSTCSTSVNRRAPSTKVTVSPVVTRSSGPANTTNTQEAMISNLNSIKTPNILLHQPQASRSVSLIEKVVNPLGTVTTITHSLSPNYIETGNQYMAFVNDYIIHENCDEALFRSVVAIVSGDDQCENEKFSKKFEYENPPATIRTDLIVPVIEEKSQETNNAVSCKETPLKKSAEVKEYVTSNIEKFDKLTIVSNKITRNYNCEILQVHEKNINCESECDSPKTVITSCSEEDGYNSKEDSKKIKATIIEAKSEELMESSQNIVAISCSSADEDISKQKNIKDLIKPRLSVDSDQKKASDITNKTKNVGYKSVEPPTAAKACDQRDVESKAKAEKSKMCLQHIICNEKMKILKSCDILETAAPSKNKKQKFSGSDIKEKSRNEFESVELWEKLANDILKTDSLLFNKSLKIDESSATFNIRSDVYALESQSEKAFPRDDHILSIENGSKKIRKQKISSCLSTSPKHVFTSLEKSCANTSKNEDSTIQVISFSSVLKSKPFFFEKQCNKNLVAEPSIQISCDSGYDIQSEDQFVPKQEINTKSSKPTYKDFPKLSLESITKELDPTPLSPLAPFDTEFESLHLNNLGKEPISLINFGSPLQEKQTRNDETVFEKESSKKTATDGGSKNKCENNLMFVTCGYFQRERKPTAEDNLKPTTTMAPQPCINCTQENRKIEDSSLEHLNESDEQYLSLTQHYHEHTLSSSSTEEENEEYCCDLGKKGHQKLVEDDEELRPLIGGANLPCSMTSLSSKKDDYSTAIEISNAIIDTLQYNNQSDSSEHAITSEQAEELDRSAFRGNLPVSSSTITNVRGEDGSVDKESPPKPAIVSTTQSTQLNCSQNAKKRPKKKKR